MRRRVHVRSAAARRATRRYFQSVRTELAVPGEFPPEALAAAAQAARRPVVADAERADLRGLELATVDPPGSRDLDQAFLLREAGDGLVLDYAIADVAAFVDRGGAIELEAWRRGLTSYSPDERSPLYPPALSEDAASLLPGRDRPAVVFTIRLDARGDPQETTVRRALVRSRRQYAYAQLAQAPQAQLLRRFGALRDRRERERSALRIDLPEQEILRGRAAADGYRLVYGRRHAIEDASAQMSLLCGFVAAGLMLEHGVGLLRTMPPPDPEGIERLRMIAHALGIHWAPGAGLDALLVELDPERAAHAAFLEAARRTLGRARYTAFVDGPPPEPVHGALQAPYAQVTAPLRRLADRYVLDLVVELAEGLEPSRQEREALVALPPVMEAAAHREADLDRALVDTLEALALQHRIGEVFSATIVARDGDRARVQIEDPPVRATVRGVRGSAGQPLRLRLHGVDPQRRLIQLEPIG